MMAAALGRGAAAARRVLSHAWAATACGVAACPAVVVPEVATGRRISSSRTVAEAVAVETSSVEQIRSRWLDRRRTHMLAHFFWSRTMPDAPLSLGRGGGGVHRCRRGELADLCINIRSGVSGLESARLMGCRTIRVGCILATCRLLNSNSQSGRGSERLERQRGQIFGTVFKGRSQRLAPGSHKIAESSFDRFACTGRKEVAIDAAKKGSSWSKVFTVRSAANVQSVVV